MGTYWWFLVPAILCALFAEKIDSAFKGNKKIKHILWIVCAGVCLILIIPLMFSFFV